ncbi:MAG: prolipoprotein diacylglyceryl transferase family protein [Spiroplasma sp.]
MINNFVGPWGITSDYGWFHVYAFTMFFGMLVSILFSWYKLYKHKIPTDGFILAIILIIPASLFGGSFFGKDDPENSIEFWKKFAFWEPGMSIHGGVLFGAIIGLIFFTFYKRKTKVSLWVYGDCIIPNILLGQVIGRWGNFFNHELLGAIIGYSKTLDANNIAALSWLPAFIRDNCFQLSYGTPEMTIDGFYVFRAPIFLYESMANLGFWVMLTFLLPNMFRWFSKKPWKVEVNKYQLLTINDLKEQKQEKNRPVRDYFVLIHRNHLLKRKYWNEAFYDYQADNFAISKINQEYKNKKSKALKEHFFVRNNLITKVYFERSNKLYYLNNPKGYIVLRSGVQMWLYFFGWNLIRFCLEIQRDDDSLFLKHRRMLDYTVLISIFSFALILAILCQLVFVRYFRNTGWTFEKEY